MKLSLQNEINEIDFITSNIKDEIEEVMKAWGRWVKSGMPKLGYPNATPFRRLLGSGVSAAELDSAPGMAINDILVILKSTEWRAYRFIELYYVNGYTLRTIHKADSWFTKPKAADQKRYVDGWLSAQLVSAKIVKI